MILKHPSGMIVTKWDFDWIGKESKWEVPGTPVGEVPASLLIFGFDKMCGAE